MFEQQFANTRWAVRNEQTTIAHRLRYYSQSKVEVLAIKSDRNSLLARVQHHSYETSQPARSGFPLWCILAPATNRQNGQNEIDESCQV